MNTCPGSVVRRSYIAGARFLGKQRRGCRRNGSIPEGEMRVRFPRRGALPTLGEADGQR
jgi:hypothetical protein